MRLTKQSSYAMRILMYCATDTKELSRVQDIANAYGLSEAFLFKIIKQLAAGNLLTTMRGRSGGIKLARPAREISLLDVVKVTEDGFTMAECFVSDYKDCPLISSCLLTSALQDALDAFFNVLATHTIQTITANKNQISTLLQLDVENEISG